MSPAILHAGGRALVVLALAGCALTGPQSSELTRMDSCAEPRDLAYESMRKQVVNAMNEQDLSLPEVLTGLEASARIRATPGAALSAEDGKFLTRHGFMGLYGGTPWPPARFVALRTCMEQRYGEQIRVIEIRPP